MKCWTNIESFDRDMPIRFTYQMEKLLLSRMPREELNGKCNHIWSFHFMRAPTSAYLQAGHLYERYIVNTLPL
ncbi:DUF5109 domain-containing protein [Bacteroides faecis]|nr:DUF5109 domain-containing protein [Bacteroides faecis]